MSMLVMQIRIVNVRVQHWFVPMTMRVRLCDRPVMMMLMVLIVYVAVFVFERFVLMLVTVALG